MLQSFHMLSINVLDSFGIVQVKVPAGAHCPAENVFVSLCVRLVMEDGAR